MIDPLFWLGFSLLLVAVSLAAVLIVALPALLELARAARSAEKLFDTLNRELPATLEAIRLTGLEVGNLTDEMNEGVQKAGRIVQQLDQNLSSVGHQAKQAQIVTHSVFAGVKAAWKSFTRSTDNPQSTAIHRGDLSEPEYEVEDDAQYDDDAEATSNSSASLRPETVVELEAAGDRNSHHPLGHSAERVSPKLVPPKSSSTEPNSTVDEWDQEDVDEKEIRSHFIP